MTDTKRYHTLAIVMHWLMALGFLAMVGSGWYMVNMDMNKATQFDLYQIHKAGGVVMLWSIVLRLLIRWLTKPPPLPAAIPNKQHRVAKLGHIGLYVGLLVIPLAGWVMVSSSPFGLPTFVFFDWLKWPHIPGIARNKEVQSIASAVHWYTVLVMLLLLAGHIGAVYIHKIKHNIALIKRMWWS